RRSASATRRTSTRAPCGRPEGHQLTDRTAELALFGTVEHHLPCPSALLPRHVPDLRPAEILPPDSFGQGRRADGAPPRGPGAEASAPWPRPLPDHGPSDPRCAQPSTSKVALALFSRHARDA